MRPLTLISLCLAVLVASIAYACSVGDFFDEGGRLLRMPWGQVTLVDLYVGFALIAGWIVYREPHRGRAAAWIVALLLLGNVVTCVYLLLAIRGARGEPMRFWLGPHRAT